MNKKTQIDASEVINLLSLRIAEKEKENAILSVSLKELEKHIKNLKERGVDK